MYDKTRIAVHCFFFLGLGNQDQNSPFVLYETITGENESHLQLGQHLELVPFAAKSQSRVIIEIDQEHQTAIAEENVNVNIDCLLWQSNFKNSTTQWYYHQRDLEGFLVGLHADPVFDSENLQSNSQWLNISQTTFGKDLELSNSGDYICEVCLYQSEECYSATLTLYLIGNLLVLMNETYTELELSLSNDGQVNESASNAQVCIKFSADFDLDFMINIAVGAPVNVSAIIQGIATSGEDYTPPKSTLTAIAGTHNFSNPLCFDIPINDDMLVEVEECFIVSISLPASAVDLAVSITDDEETSLFCIVDNDRIEIGFEKLLYEIDENDFTGSVIVAVSVLGDNLRRAAEVIFSTRDGSATSAEPSDYESITAPVQFDEQQHRQILFVYYENDNILESTENFFALLATSDEFVDLNSPETEIRIFDLDEVMIGFNPNSYLINETDGSVTLFVEVLQGTLEGSVTILFFTKSETAIQEEPEDYSAVPHVLTFHANLLRQEVNVTIINDERRENNETFLAILDSQGQPVMISPDQASVLILEDSTDYVLDVIFSFNSSCYTFTESINTGTVYIDKIGYVDYIITLHLSGTIQNGDRIDQIVTFTPSDTKIAINFRVIDDLVAVEPTESYNWSLSLIFLEDNVGIQPLNRTTIKILDDDNVSFSFCSFRYTFMEDTNSGIVYIEKIGYNAQSITLTLSGPLQRGGRIDRMITFTPSDTVIAINFAVIDDLIAQNPPEILAWTLTLATRVNGTSVEPFNMTTIEILDNGDMYVSFNLSHYEFSEDIQSASVHIVTTGEVSQNITLLLSGQLPNGGMIDQIVTITPPNTKIAINFGVIDDLVALESPESFDWTLTLITPVDIASIQPFNRTTIEILDNDDALFTFRSPRFVFTEDIRSATIYIDKSKDTFQKVAFKLSGSLQNESKIDQIVTFEPSDTEIAINFTVISDLTALEPIKSFDWTLEPITWVDRVNIHPFNMTTVEIVNNDGVVISFDEERLSVIENVGTEKLCVGIIWGMVMRDLLVSVVYEERSAKNGEDYNSDPRVLTFSPGIDRVCLNVSINDDCLFELNEDFSVIISTSDPAAVIDIRNTTISILDEEILTIGWEFSEYAVYENDHEVEICAVVSNRTKQAIMLPKINVMTADGTATKQDEFSLEHFNYLPDYGDRPNPQFFNFQPGNLTRMCTKITITMDGIVELRENFIASLDNTSLTQRVVIDPQITTITIVDIDEAIVGFTSESYTVQEGSRVFDFTVGVLSGTLAPVVEVRFNTFDGSATSTTPIDYHNLGEQILRTKSRLFHTPAIRIENDQIAENSEEFFGNLELVTNIDGVTIMPNVVRIVITDNDVPSIEFEMTHYYALENNSAVIEVCAFVTPLEKSAFAVLTTSDGTAQAPMDYANLTTTLVFSPGSRQQCVQINATEDEVTESVENFTLTLTSTDNVYLSPDVIVISILDGNVVHIRFDRPFFVFSKSDGTGTIYVVKIGVSVNLIQVRVTESPSNQSDLVISAERIDQTIEFPAGGSKFASIPVAFRISSDDIDDEAIEVFTASLEIISAVGNVLLGDPERTQIIIIDAAFQVKCFAEDDCSSNSTGMASLNYCCNHNVPPFGVAYTIAGFNECFDCHVEFGFVLEEFTAVESNNTYSVDFAFFSGKAESEFFIDVEYTAASASEADVDIFSSTLRVPEVVQQDKLQLISKEILIVLDQVSQEMDEVFILGFTYDEKKLRTGSKLRGRLNGMIKDATTISFALSDDPCRAPENEFMPIVITKDATFLATSVILRISPFTIDVAKSRGLKLPQLYKENPFSPIQADERDFGEAASITLQADEDSNIGIEFTAFMEIIDDDIDEAETQFFVVYLDLVDAVNNGLIQFSQRVSACHIIDNDDVLIGFQLSVYDYVEPDQEMLKVASVVLLKNVTSYTEQTFGVRLYFSDPESGINAAKLREVEQVNGSDYSFNNTSKNAINLMFYPSQTEALIKFFISADSLSETVEGFQINVESLGAPFPYISLQYSNLPPYPTALVRIFDDYVTNSLYADLSFKENSYMVNETDSEVEVCVEINIQQANASIDFGVRVSYATTSITADNLDYQEVDSPKYFYTFYFNDTLTHQECFNIVLLQDNLYEITELFLVNLDVDEDLTGVILARPTTEFYVIDDDEVAIGFTDEHYHVVEGRAELQILNVELLQANVHVSVHLNNWNNDYEEGFILNFTINSINSTVTVTPEDSVFEADKTWHAVLSFSKILQPPRLSILADSALVTIKDDDTLTFCSTNVILESDQVQNISIKLYKGNIGDSKINLTIAINESSSNASVGEDYTPIPSITLCFSNDEFLNDIPIEVISDLLPENREYLEFVILNVAIVNSLGIESDITHEVGNRITLNGDVFIRDRVFVSFKKELYVVNEQSGQVILEVIKHGERTADTVSVIVQTTDNSASSVGNKDFVNITKKLVFFPDEFQKLVSIEITDDNNFENFENFTAVIFENLMDCQEVSITTIPTTAIIIIEDNDRVHKETSTVISGTTIAVIITLIVIVSLTAAITIIVWLLIIKYRRQTTKETPPTNESEAYATIDELGHNAEQKNDYEVIDDNDVTAEVSKSLPTGQAVYEDIDNLEDGAGYESIPEGTTSAISYDGYETIPDTADDTYHY